MPKSRRRFRLEMLLGHISGSDQRSRYPVNFCAQFITNAPNFELGDPLSAAFERADVLLREGTDILAARLHEATTPHAPVIEAEHSGEAALRPRQELKAEAEFGRGHGINQLF